jgi:hypothetical protein
LKNISNKIPNNAIIVIGIIKRNKMGIIIINKMPKIIIKNKKPNINFNDS